MLYLDPDKLRAEINKKYPTITAFSKVCGISQAHISRYMKKQNNVTFNNLQKIMRALEITDTDLLMSPDPREYLMELYNKAQNEIRQQ